MSNIIISPNMLLPTPVVSNDPGPDWATNVVACLGQTGGGIDSHDHSIGKGVPITPAGILINADLPFGTLLSQFNAILLRSVRFFNQSAPLSLAGDIGCIYVYAGDLWYNNGAAGQVRITNGLNVNSTGSFPGLPSGTASILYNAGFFYFFSATNTPANMQFGPIKIGQNNNTPKFVTLTPNAGQSADYGLTLPAALPIVQSAFVSDNAGNESFVALASAAFIPTVVYTLAAGAPSTITPVSANFYYAKVGNIVTVSGKTIATVSGFGVGRYTTNVTIPIATAALLNNGSSFDAAPGSGLSNSILVDVSNTAVQSGGNTIQANGTLTSLFQYQYQVS